MAVSQAKTCRWAAYYLGALYAARAEEGLSGFFRFNSPATPEKIRMAASDRFSSPFAPHDFMPKASV